MRRRLLLCAITAFALVVVAAAVATGLSITDGRIGPALSATGNGRVLHPVGRLTTLGDFPTGGALSPDGRFYWAVDAGHGQDDVKIVDVRTGSAVQTLPLPGAYVGVAFGPDGRSAYVSGEPQDSPASPSQGPVKGTSGDVVHVFSVDPASGHATERAPISMPQSPTGTAKRSSFGAPITKSWPEGLAVTPDGTHLVVALNQSDQAAIVDLTKATPAVTTVSVGAYPYGVAISPDSKTAYVSNEYSGTISFVDIATAKQTGTVGVGGARGDQNAHPEGMHVDPRTGTLYVAVANRDLVAIVDPAKRTVSRSLSVERPEGIGTAPNALTESPDGRTLYVADANEDAVAAFSLVARSASLHPRHRILVPQSPRAIKRYTRQHTAMLKRLNRRLRRAHSAAARRRLRRSYAKQLTALRRRLLYGKPRLGCAGPTTKQDRRYWEAVARAYRVERRALKRAARAKTRKRRALLRRRARGATAKRLSAARRRLPAFATCAGDIRALPAFSLIGRIPTAAYPTDVQVTPDGGTLVWLAAKGLGAGPNPNFIFAGATSAGAPVPTPYGTYVLDMLVGRAGMLARPTDEQVRAMSATADAQVRPTNAEAPPAGTPVVGPGGGPSQKIKYVFYIVRENRTYDQIFGSDPRGDGDPKLELFDDNGTGTPAAGVTPNAHALARRFPLIDHFYADSEVSVDGHTITTSAYATDYEQKAVPQNYAGRGRAYDFGIFPVSFPPNDFVFDQAVRQGVSFRSYGEVAAGNVPGMGDDGRPTFAQVVANTNYTYVNEALIGCIAAGNVPGPVPSGGPGVNNVGCAHDAGNVADAPALGDPTPHLTTGVPGGTSRVDTFNADFQRQLASGSVPQFNYLVLPNDHTNGTTPGGYTPKALVADNDLALGQLVQLISHSSIWSQSAIFVVEDDSQDGADHVDAHRMPAFVISPYAVPGGVVHTRYDQYSALRTAMMMVGLKPLSLNDALATPMYDAFTNGAPDLAPYDAIQPAQDLTQLNTSASPLAKLSAKMPFNRLDQVPQAVMDRILWASVYGTKSRPPAPGPDASPFEAARAAGAMAVYRRGGNVRAWLAAHTPAPPEP